MRWVGLRCFWSPLHCNGRSSTDTTASANITIEFRGTRKFVDFVKRDTRVTASEIFYVDPPYACQGGVASARLAV